MNLRRLPSFAARPGNSPGRAWRWCRPGSVPAPGPRVRPATPACRLYGLIEW